FYALHFSNTDVGYVVGYNSTIIKTSDGGQTWTEQYTGLPRSILRDVHFYDEMIGAAVGSTGRIIVTEDGGQTWTERSLGVSFNVSFVYWINDTTAYIGTDPTAGLVYKTTNRGATWQVDPTFAPARYTLCNFISADIGYIWGFFPESSGNLLYLYKTVDGGQTWFDTNLDVDFLSRIQDIDFVSGDSVGYFKAFNIWNRQFYKTTDGGQSWQPQTQLPFEIQDFEFYNGTDGLAFAPDNHPNNKFYYTRDSGNTWIESPAPDSMTFIIDLAVVLDQPAPPGLIQPGDNAEVAIADLEFDWQDSFKPRHYRIQVSTDVGFSNILVDNTVRQSNMMLPEEELESGTTYYWRTSAVNIGSISGDWSSTHTFTTEGLVGVEPAISGAPQNYKLYANYPNPFNPSTTIRFDLPEATDLSLTIYDNTGRKVSELENGFKNAGSYELQWNAASFSSGVYLLRMETASFVSVNKMMLLK
ncbi:MAG: YCF48-related protein, partial [Calditrichota bacterium]